MGIRFFRGERTHYEHEYRQLGEIIRILKSEFEKEPLYVLTNVLVANGQIDCVLLTRNGPLILELKAFSGEVHGLENGGWEVTTKDGPIPLPNLFLQAKNQRQDFIDRLIPIYRENLSHVGDNNLRRMSSWLYFCKESMYPEGQIDFRRVKWFRIVTADTLLEKMRFLDSGYTLRLQDMDEIVQGLHLKEYNFDSDRPIPPQPVASPRNFWLTRGGMATLTLILIVFGIIALILIVPGAKLAIMTIFSGMGTGVSGLVQKSGRQLIKSDSTAADSQDAIIYLNRIRISQGVSPIAYDERAYLLAFFRAADMAGSRYLNYTNPKTGISAVSLKGQFNISANQTVVESAYGQWNGYTFGIEKQAINAWITDQGNRNRLLAPYSGGAVACSQGYCSFIGIMEYPAYSPPMAEIIQNATDELNVTGEPVQA